MLMKNNIAFYLIFNPGKQIFPSSLNIHEKKSLIYIERLEGVQEIYD